MPLFSNNKGDNGHEARPHDDEDGEQASAVPPNEHTRLLPNRVDTDRGMLSPDDPAVSPYNLWTVRILRFLTVVFTLLSFVWWVLILVTAFATPPGFHMRGSGFYAFGYAGLTMANMIFTLIFFGVPAKPVRVLAIIMAVSSSPNSPELVSY